MFSTKAVSCELAHKSAMLYEPTDAERRELKNCLLQMYKEIEQVCKEHHICIMASGGSVLGAVRHQGFIPWDDDFDILMPREDFIRFREIFPACLSRDYSLSLPEVDLSYIYPKIYKKNTRMVSLFDHPGSEHSGVHIDIFLIDAAPVNRVRRKLKAIWADGLRFFTASGIMYRQRNPVSREFFYQTKKGRWNYRIRLFCGFLCHLCGIRSVIRFYDKCVSMKEQTGICVVPTGRNKYTGEMWRREVFFPVQRCRFEDTTVCVPHRPDAYLKKMYGDYMEIPSEENRERHSYIEFEL